MQLHLKPTLVLGFPDILMQELVEVGVRTALPP